MAEVLVAVHYDVVDDRRRLRLARALADFGERTLKSHFEAWLEPEEIDRLWRRVLAIVDPQEDAVCLYELCDRCRTRLRRHGQAPPPEHARPPDTLIV